MNKLLKSGLYSLLIMFIAYPVLAALSVGGTGINSFMDLFGTFIFPVTFIINSITSCPLGESFCPIRDTGHLIGQFLYFTAIVYLVLKIKDYLISKKKSSK